MILYNPEFACVCCYNRRVFPTAILLAITTILLDRFKLPLVITVKLKFMTPSPLITLFDLVVVNYLTLPTIAALRSIPFSCLGSVFLPWLIFQYPEITVNHRSYHHRSMNDVRLESSRCTLPFRASWEEQDYPGNLSLVAATKYKETIPPT